MFLLINCSLPGIGLLEYTIVSFSNNLICLCVPLEILDNAARGSPWLPVHNSVTSFGFKLLASSGEISSYLW